ncbi:hypothetical protein Q3G72_003456 [Acer saccharum]|nr:hypothetical protein Q3G72_003456 [Acer saccharum]
MPKGVAIGESCRNCRKRRTSSDRSLRNSQQRRGSQQGLRRARRQPQQYRVPAYICTIMLARSRVFPPEIWQDGPAKVLSNAPLIVNNMTITLGDHNVVQLYDAPITVYKDLPYQSLPCERGEIFSISEKILIQQGIPVIPKTDIGDKLLEIQVILKDNITNLLALWKKEHRRCSITLKSPAERAR